MRSCSSTGANAAGYTLTSVRRQLRGHRERRLRRRGLRGGWHLGRVSLHHLRRLHGPDGAGDLHDRGHRAFTHTGLALSANTNYVVVIKQRGTGSVELNSTTSGGEDTSLGLSDWSIKNKFYWQSGSTWMLKSGSNEALRIIVSGYANTVATPPTRR